jgi:hypothetical protein
MYVRLGGYLVTRQCDEITAVVKDSPLNLFRVFLWRLKVAPCLVMPEIQEVSTEREWEMTK